MLFSRNALVALLAALMMLSFPDPATTQGTLPAEEPLRIFFISDAHARPEQVERFIEEANRELPDLILEGGDFVHDGTKAEFRRALANRARLESPWYTVQGNHDAELRGDLSNPPIELPEFRAVDHQDLRVILLDNHEKELTEEQFRRLEAELEAHAGRRIVVVMHVPPLVSRKPAATRLRHLLPFRLASPVMPDAEQVERFTGLMEGYGVLAVLAGHMHVPDHHVQGGVHYIVGGTLGGLTPGLGIANKYLEITLEGREVSVRRVAIDDPPGDPVSFLVNAFRFYADLNGFNHAQLGWSYVPSASVQLRSAVKRIETGETESVVLFGAASFERVLSEAGGRAFFADVGLSAGSRELATHLATGYKLRPLGDFNRNLYLGGAATANAGMLAATATAGVGAQLGLGVEWRNLTLEVNRNWATNHRATSLSVGHRF